MQKKMQISYKTDLGQSMIGDSSQLPEFAGFEEIKGTVSLILTSPPFPLNRKKAYGNLNGDAYINWLASYAQLFRDLLSPDGSIVIEIGNGWEPGLPSMSTISIEALLELKRRGGFFLCQEFIWENPAKLPSPASWVNVKRVRVKDSFTRIWWLSTTPNPKADNRRILKSYSSAMRELINSKKYNSGDRPSEHKIGKTSFLSDNGGAIPGSVITCANTAINQDYKHYCLEHGIKMHPARMPVALAEFFIKFLTDPGDLVLDPFGGSNTSGYTSEKNGRRWISVEANPDYIEGSKGYFPDRTDVEG